VSGKGEEATKDTSTGVKGEKSSETDAPENASESGKDATSAGKSTKTTANEKKNLSKGAVKKELAKEEGRVAALSRSAAKAPTEESKKALMRRLRIAKAKEHAAQSTIAVAQHHARHAALEKEGQAAPQAERVFAVLQAKTKAVKRQAPSLEMQKATAEGINAQSKKHLAKAIHEFNLLKKLESPEKPGSPAHKAATNFLARKLRAASAKVETASAESRASAEKMSDILARMARAESSKAADAKVLFKAEDKQLKREVKVLKRLGTKRKSDHPHVKMQRVYDKAFQEAAHRRLRKRLKDKMKHINP